MKFFKSTLSIMILFTTSSMFAARLPKATTPAAKPTARKATAKPTAQPATTTQPQTYKMLLGKIKTMPANQVVDNAGNTLQPAFVKSVLETTPRLSQIEIEALLQAAVNMHATWSGNQAKDKAALSKLSSQIQAATVEEMEMPELVEIPVTKTTKTDEAAEALKRLQAKGPAALGKAQEGLAQIKATAEATKLSKQLLAKQEAAFAELYDTSTNLLNPSYLKNRIKSVVSGPKERRTAVLDFLRIELSNKMLPEWKKRNINEKTFRNKLNEQITEAYNMAIRTQPAASQPITVEAQTIPVEEQPSPEDIVKIELGKMKDIDQLFANDQVSTKVKSEFLVPVLAALIETFPAMTKDTATNLLMIELAEAGTISDWKKNDKKELEEAIGDLYNQLQPLAQTPENLVKTELEKIQNIKAVFADDSKTAISKAEYLANVLIALNKTFPEMSQKDAVELLMAELSKIVSFVNWKLNETQAVIDTLGQYYDNIWSQK